MDLIAIQRNIQDYYNQDSKINESIKSENGVLLESEKQETNDKESHGNESSRVPLSLLDSNCNFHRKRKWPSGSSNQIKWHARTIEKKKAKKSYDRV
jgi:hypothetical protein